MGSFPFLLHSFHLQSYISDVKGIVLSFFTSIFRNIFLLQKLFVVSLTRRNSFGNFLIFQFQMIHGSKSLQKQPWSLTKGIFWLTTVRYFFKKVTESPPPPSLSVFQTFNVQHHSPSFIIKMNLETTLFWAFGWYACRKFRNWRRFCMVSESN